MLDDLLRFLNTNPHDMVSEQGTERVAMPAPPTAQAPNSRVRELEDRVDRLALLCMALFGVLKQRGLVTDADFLKLVEEIDLRDGQLDGKLHAVICECPQCHRRMSPRHQRCLYCGFADLTSDPFNEVKAAPVVADALPQPWGEG